MPTKSDAKDMVTWLEARMDTRHLRFLIAVAEAGSVTRAAEMLNISQPALTVGIRNLEAELDTKLFDRLPRGVLLTQTGEALYRHARTMFTQMEDARAEIQNLKKAVQHEVRLGVGPVWLRTILPAVVAEFTRTHPEYEVIVRSGYEQSLFAMLRTGEVEFALTEIGNTGGERTFSSRVLSTDSYAVICRADHPIAARQPVTLHDLTAYRWAMPDRADYALRRLNGLFFADNLPAPVVSLRSESVRFTTNVLVNSDLLSFVVLTGEQDRLGPGLAVLRTNFELPSRQAGIVQRSSGWLSSGARLLTEELVRRCLQENPGAPA